MGLNKSKGNMYEWVTHTWNAIKGKCFHDCSYCYVKRWGKLNPVRLDEKEFKTDLGSGNFIFVGSSCDIFAENIPSAWIIKTLEYCRKFNNKYLFQTKNPSRIIDFVEYLPIYSNICITIETNKAYPDVMLNCPSPLKRVDDIIKLNEVLISNIYITIEPIMEFDLKEFVNMLGLCEAVQINIGADSGNNKLPEPSKVKVLELISELEKFTKVVKKPNLKRLIK